MTRAQLVALIQSRLGQRTSLDATVVAELQLAQTELESEPFLPWFLETSVIDSTTFVTVASTRTLAVPTGFIREQDEQEAFMLKSGSYRYTITRKPMDVLLQDTSLASAGFPKYYDRVFNTIYLFPTPDAAYNGTLLYFVGDAVLSADGTTNNWSTYAPELLVARAGMSVGVVLRDANIVKYFTQLYEDRLTKLRQADSANREAGRARMHGDAN